MVHFISKLPILSYFLVERRVYVRNSKFTFCLCNSVKNPLFSWFNIFYLLYFMNFWYCYLVSVFLALIPQVGLIWFFLVWMFLVMWVRLSDVLGEVSTPWSPLGCPYIGWLLFWLFGFPGTVLRGVSVFFESTTAVLFV